MATNQNVLISIEGNIGAGKTTFLRTIRNTLDLQFEILEEPVSEWKKITNPSSTQSANLLQLFYEDPLKWGFAFQSYCFFTRLREFQKMKETSNLKSGYIYLFERSIFSDKNVFALNAYENKLMNEIEWKSYNYSFDLMSQNVDLKYNGIIYLNVKPDKCLERIVKRGRPEENDLPLDYLKQIDEKHEKWFSSQSLPILNIEWEDVFIENPDKQKQIASLIKTWIKEKFY